VPFFGRPKSCRPRRRAPGNRLPRAGVSRLVFYVRREKMRRTLTLVSLGLVLLFGSAGQSKAEVKRVQMHIAGYLCGN
jgi:hypothetical protein